MDSLWTEIIGAVGIVNLVVIGVAWGKMSNKLDNIYTEAKRTNGRLTKLENTEKACQLDFEGRVSTIKTNQISVMNRVDKLENDR